MAHAIKLLPIVLIFSLSINAHAQQRPTVPKVIAQIATGREIGRLLNFVEANQRPATTHANAGRCFKGQHQ